MAELNVAETAALTVNRRPFLVIAGAQGSGKSTEVGGAFSDWLFYKTRNDTHAGLRDYIETYPEEAKRRGIVMPKNVKTLVDDRDSRGNPLTNWAAWYRDTLHKISVAAKAGKFPFPGVVFDEYNTLLDWMQQSCWRSKAERGEGLPGYFGQDEMMKLITWTHQVRAASGIGIACVMHWDEPQYFKEGPRVGELQYPGRPALPLARYVPHLTKDASAIWHLVAHDASTRKYYCRSEMDGTAVLRLRKTGLFNKEVDGSQLLDSDGAWEVRDGLGLREALAGLGWDVSGKAATK